MDYTQAIANFGFKYSLDWRGRRLVFSFLSDKQRAWYETQMKRAQLEEVNSSELLLDHEREKERTKLLRAVANGAFRFGGPIYRETINTPRGQEWFIMMLLIEHQPELTETDIQKLIEEKQNDVTAVLSLVFADSAAEANKLTGPRKEALLADIYKKLVLPPEEGGCGQTLETIAAMTDRQKIELFLSLDKPDEPQKPYSSEEVRRIDSIMRQHGVVK